MNILVAVVVFFKQFVMDQKTFNGLLKLTETDFAVFLMNCADDDGS